MVEKVERFENAGDFIAYRNRYSFPLGEQILERVGRLIRSQGYLTYDQLIEISDWKAGRRNRRHIRKNVPPEKPENYVVETTKHALSFGDDELRVRALHYPNLHGVRVPMASAILTFYDPKQYGVIDKHTSRALYRNRETLQRKWRLNSRFLRKKKLLGLTIDDYIEYLRVIRTIAEKYQRKVK